MGGCDISEGSLAISLCSTVLGPWNIKKLFAHRSERTKWSVWWNELKEIEWQVFMDGTISDRKPLMENTFMQRQPVELSESRGNVITFLLPVT